MAGKGLPNIVYVAFSWLTLAYNLKLFTEMSCKLRINRYWWYWHWILRRKKKGNMDTKIIIYIWCRCVIYQVIWLPFSLSIRVIVLFVHSCGYRLFLYLHSHYFVIHLSTKETKRTINKVKGQFKWRFCVVKNWYWDSPKSNRTNGIEKVLIGSREEGGFK